MPDPKGDFTADEETSPDTSLHAYSEGREADIAGDKGRFLSNDPKRQQASDIDDEERSQLGPPAHEKA